MLGFQMDELTVLPLQHRSVGSCVGRRKSPPDMLHALARRREAQALGLHGRKIPECSHSPILYERKSHQLAQRARLTANDQYEEPTKVICVRSLKHKVLESKRDTERIPFD
jgi:hypothetical protein